LPRRRPPDPQMSSRTPYLETWQYAASMFRSHTRSLPSHQLFYSPGWGWNCQFLVRCDADGCADGKRCRQIGQQTPDILTGVARTHPPGSVFRPSRLGSHRPGAGPGGAGVARRCLLAAPAAKTWTPYPTAWTVGCVCGAWGGAGVPMSQRGGA
jgi:hypothetical protein